jgi:L-fuconolactonase
VPRVDAHQHFWDPSLASYPWMSGRFEPLRRRFGPSDLRPLLVEQRIDATVLVQVRPSLEETREFLALAAETDFVAGVVGWVDLTAPDVADTLDRLRAGPGGERLVGVRHQLDEEPDPDWIMRADVRRGLCAVQQAGLRYDLLVWAREMPFGLEVARAMPDLRFVLDHLGKPTVGRGRDERWEMMIRDLARLDNVTVKLSGLVTEVRADHWTADDVRPCVDVVMESFGPSRVMFGSDWPVCCAATDYGTWVSCVERLLGGLSASERARVFGGVASDVYGLNL